MDNTFGGYTFVPFYSQFNFQFNSHFNYPLTSHFTPPYKKKRDRLGSLSNCITP